MTNHEEVADYFKLILTPPVDIATLASRERYTTNKTQHPPYPTHLPDKSRPYISVRSIRMLCEPYTNQLHHQHLRGLSFVDLVTRYGNFERDAEGEMCVLISGYPVAEVR